MNVEKKQWPIRGNSLTMEQATKRACMSPRWFYDQMAKGTLPFAYYLLSPGKRVFDSADIDEWLLKSKVLAGKFPGEK